MKIVYLLADNQPSGGIRVALAQADALIERGHEVTLVSTSPPVTWRSTNARWMQVSSLTSLREPFDFIVGTFWRTVRDAHALGGDRAVHLCQGYEGAFTAYAALKSQIDDVYRLPIPKITVSRHLVPICRQFHDDATYIGQIVDCEFYRDRRPPANDPPRVLLCGQAQADMKGIDDGYGAVRFAQAAGHELRLVRASSWTPADGEPHQEIDEFHVALPTGRMTELMHSSDVLIAPNRREEGFGLPAAEALASRIPVVMTQIPSYLSWDEQHDYAFFAPERNPAILGEQLIEALRNGDRVIARGAEVAEQFRADRVGARLEEFFTARKRTSGR